MPFRLFIVYDEKWGRRMAKDMTQGNLARTLISFSVPLIFSGLLQQLYNWADAFIVGNVEGGLALGAIGATGTISNFCIMAITGFTLGLSILSAQLYGQREMEKVRNVLSSFTFVVGGVFLLLGGLGILFTGEILRLLHTPEDIFEISRGYLRIILCGIPCLAVYNVYSAVLRGIGDSKAPFLAVIVSAVTNVTLDIIFVALLRYGAKGAAVATVIAQVLMTGFTVIYTVRRYPELRYRPNLYMIDKEILRRGAALGTPTAIQSSISSLGSMALQNFMNGFGTPTVTAITTAYRVDTVMMLPIINLGSGIATVVAQNMGVGNYRRARRTWYVGAVMIALISLLLSVLMMTAGGSLIAMFGVSQEEVEIGARFFRGIACFYLFFGFATSMRGFLEGMGDVLYTSITGMLALGVRIILSYGLADQFGRMIIAYAEAISWMTMILLYFVRLIWKKQSFEKGGLKKQKNVRI